MLNNVSSSSTSTMSAGLRRSVRQRSAPTSLDLSPPTTPRSSTFPSRLPSVPYNPTAAAAASRRGASRGLRQSSAAVFAVDGLTTIIRHFLFTRDSWTTVAVLLLLTTGLFQTEAIEWLAVAKRRNRFWNRTAECHVVSTEGLARGQRRLCVKQLDLMPAVVYSAHQTAQVCQEMFYDSRWNCSNILLAPKFMPDLTGGTREQAVTYALASASLLQSVARSCSAGSSMHCGCGTLPTVSPHPPGTGFEWGGCSDNVQYATGFVQSFLEATSAKRKKKNPTNSQLANWQNYVVGVKMMKNSLMTSCKCHGVSGSCAVKTCWKSLPDLRPIGAALLRSYYMAVEVESKRSPDGALRLELVVDVRNEPLNDTQLVFYTKSPDYCLPDPAVGSVGTKDRECQKEDLPSGSGSCRTLCCGRGYITSQMEVHDRCECKYYWCCYVKCKTCSRTVEVSKCR